MITKILNDLYANILTYIFNHVLSSSYTLLITFDFFIQNTYSLWFNLCRYLNIKLSPYPYICFVSLNEIVIFMIRIIGLCWIINNVQIYDLPERNGSKKEKTYSKKQTLFLSFEMAVFTLRKYCNSKGEWIIFRSVTLVDSHKAGIQVSIIVKHIT